MGKGGGIPPCIGYFQTTHVEKITKFPKHPHPTEISLRLHFIVTGKNCDEVSVQCVKCGCEKTCDNKFLYMKSTLKFELKMGTLTGRRTERSKLREVPSTMGFVPLWATVATPDERGAPYSMTLTT